MDFRKKFKCYRDDISNHLVGSTHLHFTTEKSLVGFSVMLSIEIELRDGTVGPVAAPEILKWGGKWGAKENVNMPPPPGVATVFAFGAYVGR